MQERDVANPAKLLVLSDAAGPDGMIRLRLVGEVDIEEAQDLELRLTEIVSETGRCELDMSEITFFNSSGLRVLAEHWARAQEAGGSLVVRNPSPLVRRVLEITALDRLLLDDGAPAGPGPAQDGMAALNGHTPGRPDRG
jgi:anti-sigma B factor antagonist